MLARFNSRARKNDNAENANLSMNILKKRKKEKKSSKALLRLFYLFIYLNEGLMGCQAVIRFLTQAYTCICLWPIIWSLEALHHPGISKKKARVLYVQYIGMGNFWSLEAFHHPGISLKKNKKYKKKKARVLYVQYIGMGNFW